MSEAVNPYAIGVPRLPLKTLSEVKAEREAGARKDDAGKLRYDLIPPEALDELARVYTIGAAKYGDNNWRQGKGLSWGRVFAAMMRHGWSWWRGETYDPVDGQHHLSSVAWCAFTLMVYELQTIGTDTRTGVAK